MITDDRLQQTEAEAQEALWQGTPETLRLSSGERMAVLAQLSVMLESGIQLPAALAGLREQSVSPRVVEVLTFLEEVVRNGQPLSVALAAVPRAFPGQVGPMVAAGEKAGRLGEMILRVTEAMESEEELKGKLRSAVLYPTIMMGLAVCVVVFLLTAIVPRFAGLFEGKEQGLPVPTRILMSLGDFFSTHWLWLLPGTAVLVVGLVMFLRSPRGAPYLDGLLLRLPVVGGIYRSAILVRTSRTLGLLIQSGVSILAALEKTRDVAGSTAFARLWNRVQTEVANGATVSDSIHDSELLPQTYRQIVASGEAAAQLDRVLLKIAGHYTSELQRKVRDVATVLEPVLVVIMGGVVGFIAMSIMLPIFRMSRS